jgi:endoglucanase
MMKNTLGLLLLLISLVSAGQENLSENIRLNQVGFYPKAEKIAIVVDEKFTEFFIASSDGKKKYFSGKLSDVKQSSWSPRKTRIADFSAFVTQGKFIVVVPGLGRSHPFEIRPKIHEAVGKGSIKGFYYQRFSMPLEKRYAGKWARPSSLSHNEIIIHPSAASEKRPAGSVIRSPKGWIDAGDYNKYIVNSGITTGTLLSAYEDFSSYYDTLKLNIPESGNALPDLLDEVLWNLRWMLTMQDPDDGGVYHKCTNAKFDAMVMPHQATAPRYVVQKGTGAALNFAAVTAQAARVFKKFDKQLPGLSDSCITAAIAAWKWAAQNPNMTYDQNKMNETFDPDVTTGAYGDRNFTDESIWAAGELYASTKDVSYLKSVNFFPDSTMPVPSWNQVKLLGYYTLLRFEKLIPAPSRPMVAELKRRVTGKADQMILDVATRPYRIVMGGSAREFVWGSSGAAANQGILLIQAYRITNDRKYLDHALGNLDYLLGRNGTGYSFLTGYGDKTPMHIHHRPSEADGIEEPVPGLLSGGPNPGMQDKCTYASSVPDEAFTDDVCSYASNEIAINWNAPLVYLVGAIEATQFQVQYADR